MSKETTIYNQAVDIILNSKNGKECIESLKRWYGQDSQLFPYIELRFNDIKKRLLTNRSSK